MMFVIQTDESSLLDVDANTVRTIIDSERAWQLSDPRNADKTATVGYILCSIDQIGQMAMSTDAIPVGSLEFCSTVARVHGVVADIPAINIPKPLCQPQYTQRDIVVARTREETVDAVASMGACYIKPYDVAKRFPATLVSSVRDIVAFPYLEPFFVSRAFPLHGDNSIESEWRVFFSHGKATPVGVVPYASASRWLYHTPSRDFAEKVLSQLQPMMLDGTFPPSGTLDIAVLQNGNNAIIEMHPFISCGLYGFEDSAILPMLRDSWHWFSKFAKRGDSTR